MIEHLRRETHPQPQGGTDLMGPRPEWLRSFSSQLRVSVGFLTFHTATNVSGKLLRKPLSLTRWSLRAEINLGVSK